MSLRLGLVNQKKTTKEKLDIFKDIDFVAYEVIKPDNLKPSEQFKFLESLKPEIKIVKYSLDVPIEKLTNNYLSDNLIEERNNYKYTIDGIIVSNDKTYKRESKNPEHAFAFKMVLSDQTAEAKVLDVLWTPSKDGFLKPRVQIEPITINGVTISFATGKNGRFIKDNNIGVGAIVKIIRSGDVIPDIIDVINGASLPLMPTEEYEWNETNAEIILKNVEDNETVRLKKITKFFKDLKIEGLGEKNIEKIINSGNDSLSKILLMTIDDYKKVENFGKVMAKKVHDGIKEKVSKASIAKLASASNIFGRNFGEKRINAIIIKEPKIITEDISKEEKVDKIKIIDGIGLKTAKQFVENIEEFKEFIKLVKLEDKFKNSEKSNSEKSNLDLDLDSLNNKIIVMSDFNSKKITKKEMETKLEKLGVKIEKSITKKTDILITGDISSETTKMKKAKEYNIEVIDVDSFIK